MRTGWQRVAAGFRTKHGGDGFYLPPEEDFYEGTFVWESSDGRTWMSPARLREGSLVDRIDTETAATIRPPVDIVEMMKFVEDERFPEDVD